MKYLIILITAILFIACNGSTKNESAIEKKAAIETTTVDYLTEAVLKTKSKEELRILRNEVFARKGYIFKSEDLNNYFKTKAWYQPDAKKEVTLSDEEQYYIDKIKDIENLHQQTKITETYTEEIEEDYSEYTKSNTDYYSELSDPETKLLDATYKVACIENSNFKSFPALIGLSPISRFYVDIFNDIELARIIASAYKKNDIDAVYYLKYSSLTGITRYNEQLDWNEISRDSIIAKIEVIENDNLKLWWYGFYDKKQKKRVYLKSDFNRLGGKNPVILKKCLKE